MSNENLPKFRTFRHLNAGSTTIMSDGTRLQFLGPIGGHGTLLTSDPEQIAHLEKLCKSSNMAWEEVATQEFELPAKVLAVEEANLRPAVENTERAAIASGAGEVSMSPQNAAVAKLGVGVANSAIATTGGNPRLAALAAQLGGANPATPPAGTSVSLEQAPGTGIVHGTETN